MYTLITAATSAKAYKLKNMLNSGDVILGDHRELPNIMLEKSNMIKLPNPASASYTHEMLTLCLDKQIDKVYALGEEEFTQLNTAKQLFGEYGVSIFSEES
jgi:hypothetical protein